MKSIAKNLGKLNQYVGERFAKASKHEVTGEFKLLEQQTEIRKEGTDAILDAAYVYLKTLEKKTEGNDKAKHMAVETFGIALIQYGSDLSETSVYGQALIKLGETEQRIAEIQSDYVTNIRADFVRPLEEYMAEMKTYKHLRSKLESRRLDYDAKLNRLQKSKKEKPDLDEEMRQAQTKYEETLVETEELMISLNSCEEAQLQNVLAFMEAQQQFYAKAAEMLLNLKSTILDSTIKGNRMARPSRLFDIHQTPMSQRSTIINTVPPTPPRNLSSVSQNDPYLSNNPGLNVPPAIRHGSTASTTDTVITSDTTGLKSSIYPSTLGTTPALSRGDSHVSHDVTATSTAATPTSIPRERKFMRANYSFAAENPDELSISKGDVIAVVSEDHPGWWIGEVNGRQGLFPVYYCELLLDDSTTSSQQLEASASSGQLDPRRTLFIDHSQVPSAQETPRQTMIIDHESQRESVVPTQKTAEAVFQTQPQPADEQKDVVEQQQPMLPKSSSIPKFSYMDPTLGGSPFSLRKSKESLNTSNNNLPAANTEAVAACSTCGCDSFSQNVFKPGNCNNCFHTH